MRQNCVNHASRRIWRGATYRKRSLNFPRRRYKGKIGAIQTQIFTKPATSPSRLSYNDGTKWTMASVLSRLPLWHLRKNYDACVTFYTSAAVSTIHSICFIRDNFLPAAKPSRSYRASIFFFYLSIYLSISESSKEGQTRQIKHPKTSMKGKWAMGKPMMR